MDPFPVTSRLVRTKNSISPFPESAVFDILPHLYLFFFKFFLLHLHTSPPPPHSFSESLGAGYRHCAQPPKKIPVCISPKQGHSNTCSSNSPKRDQRWWVTTRQSTGAIQILKSVSTPVISILVQLPSRFAEFWPSLFSFNLEHFLRPSLCLTTLTVLKDLGFSFCKIPFHRDHSDASLRPDSGHPFLVGTLQITSGGNSVFTCPRNGDANLVYLAS